MFSTKLIFITNFLFCPILKLATFGKREKREDSIEETRKYEEKIREEKGREEKRREGKRRKEKRK